jgi:adenylyl cyclase-associated protein
MAEPTLTSLLARLEAATDRLESIVLASAVDASKSTPQPSPKPSTSTNTIPASVENFDQLIQGSVKRFIELSEQLDEPIKEQSKVFSELFQLGRQLIYVASQSKKPDYNSAEFAELLGPTQTALNKILTYKDENRGSPFFNHLSTISEGSSAFGWITMEPAPAPYIEEVKNSAIFYSNRILKEYKDKDPKHVDWAKAFIQVLDDLRDYVKEYHTTGLVWNPQGGDVLDVAGKFLINHVVSYI